MNLFGQFSCGRQDNSINSVRISAQMLQQGQTKCGCFATARRGQGQDVRGAMLQQKGNDRTLDRRRSFQAQRTACLYQGIGQAEISKGRKGWCCGRGCRGGCEVRRLFFPLGRVIFLGRLECHLPLAFSLGLAKKSCHGVIKRDRITGRENRRRLFGDMSSPVLNQFQSKFVGIPKVSVKTICNNLTWYL